MRLLSRASNFSFYSILFLLAFFCFYFSIAEGLFAWIYPDEVAPSGLQKLGIYKCVKKYYADLTINRVSAALGVCSMAKLSAFFSSPFKGWVFARLFFYLFIPTSIAFFLKQLINIPLKISFSLGFLLAAMSFFTIAYTEYYMFGLDLAIYALATASFFVCLALFPKSINHHTFFVYFCVFFGININSHEICLAISAAFIPLYAWYRYKALETRSSSVIKYVLEDRNLLVLTSIFIISFLITTLAPSLKVRQAIWPSSGGVAQGLIFVLLSIEEFFYIVVNSYLFVFMAIFLGVVLRAFNIGRVSSGYKLFYLFLFSSPVLYLLLTGYLVGITPTLWIGSFRGESYRWLEQFLADTPLRNQGGFSIRQNLFLYCTLFVNFLLLGFIFTGFLSRNKSRIACLSNKASVNGCMAFILLFSSTFFLFHPDGAGSFHILTAIKEKRSDLDKYSSQQKQNPFKDTSIMAYMFPGNTELVALSNVAFPPHKNINHASNIANIILDNYFSDNKGGVVSARMHLLIFDFMILGYQVSKNEPWKSQIYSLYKVSETS